MMDVLDFSKIKLVAMDMDGTALNSNHALSPRTIAAVKAVYSKGIKVIFAFNLKNSKEKRKTFVMFFVR